MFVAVVLVLSGEVALDFFSHTFFFSIVTVVITIVTAGVIITFVVIAFIIVQDDKAVWQSQPIDIVVFPIALTFVLLIIIIIFFFFFFFFRASFPSVLPRSFPQKLRTNDGHLRSSSSFYEERERHTHTNRCV